METYILQKRVLRYKLDGRYSLGWVRDKVEHGDSADRTKTSYMEQNVGTICKVESCTDLLRNYTYNYFMIISHSALLKVNYIISLVRVSL